MITYQMYIQNRLEITFSYVILRQEDGIKSIQGQQKEPAGKQNKQSL